MPGSLRDKTLDTAAACFDKVLSRDSTEVVGQMSGRTVSFRVDAHPGKPARIPRDGESGRATWWARVELGRSPLFLAIAHRPKHSEAGPQGYLHASPQEELPLNRIFDVLRAQNIDRLIVDEGWLALARCYRYYFADAHEIRGALVAAVEVAAILESADPTSSAELSPEGRRALVDSLERPSPPSYHLPQHRLALMYAEKALDSLQRKSRWEVSGRLDAMDVSFRVSHSPLRRLEYEPSWWVLTTTGALPLWISITSRIDAPLPDTPADAERAAARHGYECQASPPPITDELLNDDFFAGLRQAGIDRLLFDRGTLSLGRNYSFYYAEAVDIRTAMTMAPRLVRALRAAVRAAESRLVDESAEPGQDAAAGSPYRSVEHALPSRALLVQKRQELARMVEIDRRRVASRAMRRDERTAVVAVVLAGLSGIGWALLELLR